MGGEFLIDRLKFGLDQCLDLGVLHQLLESAEKNLLLGAKLEDFLTLDRDQGGDLTTPLTQDDAVFEEARKAGPVLDLLRRNTPAVDELDELFFPARDVESAFRIQEAKVPGVEPAVLEDLGSLVGALPVAQKVLGGSTGSRRRS